MRAESSGVDPDCEDAGILLQTLFLNRQTRHSTSASTSHLLKLRMSWDDTRPPLSLSARERASCCWLKRPPAVQSAQLPRFSAFSGSSGSLGAVSEKVPASTGIDVSSIKQVGDQERGRFSGFSRKHLPPRELSMARSLRASLTCTAGSNAQQEANMIEKSWARGNTK